MQSSTPELSTFEQLLVSIDGESEQKNFTNDSKNDDFGFDISIESLQNHMNMLNTTIKNELSGRERGELFASLFDTCLPNVCANNSYWIANWIIQLLENSFWGMKFYCNNNINNSRNKNDNNNKTRNWKILKQSLSKHNQMNLICVNYLLKHKYELQNLIEQIIQSGDVAAVSPGGIEDPMSGNYNVDYYGVGGEPNSSHEKRKQARIVQSYLQNYVAKCDGGLYFQSRDKSAKSNGDDDSLIDSNNIINNNSNSNIVDLNSNVNNTYVQSDDHLDVMITSKKICDSHGDTSSTLNYINENKEDNNNDNKQDKQERESDNDKDKKDDKNEKGDKLLEINCELIDILRNMLIEMATVYRITKIAEDSHNNPGLIQRGIRIIDHPQQLPYQQQTHKQEMHYPMQSIIPAQKFEFYDHNLRKTVNGNNWLLSSIDRYLNLKLIDLSVVINGITLYHLLVQRNYLDQLALVLKSGQCDWSAFKDNNNQVKKRFLVLLKLLWYCFVLFCLFCFVLLFDNSHHKILLNYRQTMQQLSHYSPNMQ